MTEDKSVSYLVFEGESARHERTVKKLTIALVISIILIFCSNLAWLYVWSQYDYSSCETETTYEQDGEGVNIIGDTNHVTEVSNPAQNTKKD